MSRPVAGNGGQAARVPRQLPADVHGFVNRFQDLARLDEIIDDRADPGATIVVVGTAGVGKTSLAVHWAHRVRERFPDGQLYVNLHGYDPGPPVTPHEVLERFLHALDVPGPAVPADPESRAALFAALAESGSPREAETSRREALALFETFPDPSSRRHHARLAAMLTN